jgi:hypothetical protein
VASDALLSAEQIQAITEAFDFLDAGLREAKQRFQTGEHGGRDGSIHALETVIKFLSLYETVQTEALYAPLSALFNALMSLDDGEVQPILRKAKRKGRGRASAGRESFKGIIAATVHGLSEDGVLLAEAFELVASHLNKEGILAERGRFPKITARTVRGWYEGVAADVGRHVEAAQTFDLLLKEIASVKSTDPENFKRNLFDRLSHVIRATRESKKPVNPHS